MKKSSLFKITIVLGLSLMVIMSLTNLVLATSDDEFDWNNAVVVNSTDDDTNTTNTADDNTTNTADDNTTNTTGTNSTNDTNSTNGTNISNSVANNVSNNTSNTSTNDLADTGIGNTNMIIALVVVVGLGVAIYSYKRIKEYNNV